MAHLVGRRTSFSAAVRRQDSAAPERTCLEAGCITRLSRYNTSDHCFLHAPVRFPRFRGQFTPEYRRHRERAGTDRG